MNRCRNAETDGPTPGTAAGSSTLETEPLERRGIVPKRSTRGTRREIGELERGSRA